MPDIEDLLPQTPTEGPPLPTAFGIKWPWGSPYHRCMARCLMERPMVGGKLVTPRERMSYCAKKCKGLTGR